MDVPYGQRHYEWTFWWIRGTGHAAWAQCQLNHHLVQSKQSTHRKKTVGLTSNSILIQQEAREGAVIPGAAIDGATVQSEPHLVSLEEWQGGLVASSLMIWGSIIGISAHHYLLIAHEINVQWHVDGKLQDAKAEEIGAINGAGEAANVAVVHLPQVSEKVVKHNGLVQVARREVGSARGSEGHAQRLGQREELPR